MIQKQNYVAPAAECLDVAIEKRFLDSQHPSSFTDEKAYMTDPTAPGGSGWTWENNN